MNVAEAEDVADEAVIPTSKFSQPGMDTNVLKNNVPHSITEGKYETFNKDSSLESVTPKISVEDTSEFQEISGDLESTTQPAVGG